MPCSRSSGGVVLSQHALQEVSQHALQQVSRGGWPTPKGEVEGDLVQAHPQPRGKLRGIWSRPTAKGEIEGDLVQALSQGGS